MSGVTEQRARPRVTPNVSLAVNGAYAIIFFLVGMLLIQPSWPLAFGVAAACAAIAYVAKLVISSGSSAGA